MRIVSLTLAGVLAVGATACSSGPRTPDEYRVVRKAPLTVPPEYNLRPPAPGEARPQELSPDAEAQFALFGRDLGAEATDGEKMLVQAAGGDAVDQSIRASVDYDSSQTLRKNRSFADSILSFGSNDGTQIVDAAAEAERLREQQAAVEEVTGGGEVMIRRKRASKLPGL